MADDKKAAPPPPPPPPPPVPPPVRLVKDNSQNQKPAVIRSSKASGQRRAGQAATPICRAALKRRPPRNLRSACSNFLDRTELQIHNFRVKQEERSKSQWCPVSPSTGSRTRCRPVSLDSPAGRLQCIRVPALIMRWTCKQARAAVRFASGRLRCPSGSWAGSACVSGSRGRAPPTHSFVNGKIVTVDGRFTIAQGVAIGVSASSRSAPPRKSSSSKARTRR